VGLFALTFLMSPTTQAVDLCPVHRWTHLPCPGCGLSRAMSFVSQGDPLTALGANPFVLFAWPLLVALALLALMPKTVRQRVDHALVSHEAIYERSGMVLFYAFIGFGALRAAWCVWSGVPFP
jgi:hypothetical protein